MSTKGRKILLSGCAVLLLGILLVAGAIAAYVLSRPDRQQANMLDDREVFVRIDNQTEYRVDRVRLGSRAMKPNSYWTHYYGTKFPAIDAGEVTSYRKTGNVPMGYDLLIVYAGRISAGSTKAQRASMHSPRDYSVPPEFCSPVKWEHPFLPEKMFEGMGLEGGYYTIRISDWEVEDAETNWDDSVTVSIMRDDRED